MIIKKQIEVKDFKSSKELDNVVDLLVKNFNAKNNIMGEHKWNETFKKEKYYYLTGIILDFEEDNIYIRGTYSLKKLPYENTETNKENTFDSVMGFLKFISV